mgnify:CR=1 FL=1
MHRYLVTFRFSPQFRYAFTDLTGPERPLSLLPFPNRYLVRYTLQALRSKKLLKIRNERKKVTQDHVTFSEIPLPPRNVSHLFEKCA